MTEKLLTAKEWQRQILEVRARYARERKRIWPEGSKGTCPSCHKKALLGRSDLSREIDANGAVLVFANLHGASCENCKTEILEGYDQMAIEDRAGMVFRAPMSGSVTALGGNKLGTYWPKDIARALGMHAKDSLDITALSSDTLVVRVKHDHS